MLLNNDCWSFCVSGIFRRQTLAWSRPYCNPRMNESKEAELESSIKEYEQQLCQIQAALQCADDSMTQDLLKLQQDLQQLISLSQESLQSMRNNAAPQVGYNVNSTDTAAEFDDEMALFQAEIALLDGDGTSTGADTKTRDVNLNNSDNFESSECAVEENDSLFSQLQAMEGMKCQAPFSTEYGHLGYHSAVIHKVQLGDDINSMEDVQVRVMFSHPCVKSMKPCPYYLDDRCNYGVESCRFSHGHAVPFADIREYVEPNYDTLKSGGRCLVASDAGLWKAAVIRGREEGPDNDTVFIVQLEQTNTTTGVTSSQVLPLGYDEGSDEEENVEDLSESRLEDDYELDNPPSAIRPLGQVTIGFGNWEKHTRGIGSILMARMGYIPGQGLGKSGEGRLEPIEAVVLPQGKSLDKCMELKALSNNPVMALRILKKKEKEKRKIAAGYHAHHRKTNSVFDFLNNKLGDQSKNSSESNQGPQTSGKKSQINLKTASNHSLNVQDLKLDKEMREISVDLTKLQQSLEWNQTRDKVVASSLVRKIAAQRNRLEHLQRTKGLLENEQSNRTSKQKLTIF